MKYSNSDGEIGGEEENNPETPPKEDETEMLAPDLSPEDIEDSDEVSVVVSDDSDSDGHNDDEVEVIMELWTVTGQESISGVALVVVGTGVALASGTGDFTFTNTVTGETHNASYDIMQTNKGGIYAQAGLKTNNVGNPLFETSAEFPAGTTPQEVASSYEGIFSSFSIGLGVVSVSYFEGGVWSGSSVNTFAGGSTTLGVALGEFNYELRYIYE